MKTTSVLIAALIAISAEPALACAPPPPGWVPPTPAQLRSTGIREAVDIVYGRVEVQRVGAPALRIYHVYKGPRIVGDTMAVTSTHDFPVPMCAGMMQPPPAAPVGTYGVFLTRPYSTEPVLIPPAEVQAMIAQGLIRSAQAR